MNNLRVLVACEFSQIVTKAFREKGHEAFSCDILPTEGNPDWHIQGDVLEILNDGWDMMIAHPPCTYLTVSANKWYGLNPDRYFDRIIGAEFFLKLALANIEKIAVENPIGCMSGFYRKPDQVIQPWMFGHGETKETCLWLKNLPPLQRTHRKDDFFCDEEPEAREQRLHLLPPSPDRWKERSRTFPGIAKSMAEQWG